MKSTKVLNLLIASLGVFASACNSTNNNIDSIEPSTNGAEPCIMVTCYMDRYVTFGDEIYGAYTFVPTFEVVDKLEDNYVVDYCFRFLDYGSFDETKDYLLNHFNVWAHPLCAYYHESKRDYCAKSEDAFIFDYDNLIFKIRIEQNGIPKKGWYFTFAADPDNICYDEISYCSFKINII